MNETFGSNQNNTNSQAPQPTGWAPQPVTPVTPAASSPFEASPIPNITGPASAPPIQDIGPVMMEPAKPKSSMILYIVLITLLIVGLAFLVYKMGWLNKIGGPLAKKTTPTPTITTPVIVVNKNDATRKTDLVNLKTALTKYFDAKQSYPISTTFSKTSDPDTSLKVLVPDYISSLPVDPLSPNNWYGYKSIDGKSFTLTAVLEDESDQTGVMEGLVFLYTVTDVSKETPSTSDPYANPTPEITSSPIDLPVTDTLTPQTDTSSSSSSTSDSGSTNSSSGSATDTSSSASSTSSDASANADSSIITP